MSITKAKVIGANVSYETYSRQDENVSRGNPAFSMSRGELVNFAINPKRWLDGYKAEQEATKATEWGSLLDCLLTDGANFGKRYAVAPATYQAKGMKCPSCGSVTDSKSCRKCGEEREPITIEKPWDGKATICKDWEEAQGAKQVIKAELKADADKAVAAIQANPVTRELFEVSAKQVMVIGFWKDEATGIEVPIRCLIDCLPPVDHEDFRKWIVDSKTARDGNPSKWDAVIAKEAYDWQAAIILDLYTAATSEERIDFIHVVQENVFPFHVVDPLPAMSVEFLDWGRAKYRAALRLYCQCLATKKWPSFAPAGLSFGLTQIISPDNVWAYKSLAGMAEFRRPEDPYEKRPEPKPSEMPS